MANKPHDLVITSNQSGLRATLEDEFGKDTVSSSIYPMTSCGNVWVLKEFPHDSSTVSERLDEYFSKLEANNTPSDADDTGTDDEESKFIRPLYVVFSVTGSPYGYYHVSLWKALSESNSVG